jgi:hypothetical protein
MSQLIVGLIAFVLSVWPATVAELEKKPKYKIGLPIAVGVIAITGWSVAESNNGKLNDQLTTMYNQVRLEATKDDIGTLVTHIDNGFKSVTDAIASLCKPQKAVKIPQQTVVQPPLPTPPHVGVAQARTVSTDPQFKFALQVTIQSDQQMPASFAIECTGEVGKVEAFLVGHTMGMGVMLGTLTNNPSVAIVHFEYPPLSPQSPLVVTILSKEDIRVKAVKPY